MSWPTGWACGPSGPRRQQTPAREHAPRTGTCAPMPPSTSGWLKSSTMHGSCHEATEAGCSWRKWAPLCHTLQ
eukprot:14191641-Alexandrium_andersonii.AAC.1